MDAIANVDIDSGRFKYVLINIIDAKNNKQKYIVRGYSWAAYHGDIVDQIEPHVRANKLECDCVGGGRIEHNPEAKSIKVYGYSQGYGKADHSLTCQLLKQHFSDYQSITWSDEGY